MQPHQVKHILIHCTFNIGDVVLTLPLAGILKTHFPNCRISFLGYEYTRDISMRSEFIDAFYAWDDWQKQSESDAITLIQSLNFDVVIHESPDKAVASLLKSAKIPLRIGTMNRPYHWFTCNRLVRLSRKDNRYHEAVNSLKLLKPFRISCNTDVTYLQNKMGLRKSIAPSDKIKNILKPNLFNIIIHPFTNKHTLEWPISYFNQLIQSLPRDRFHIIITGSKNESPLIHEKIISVCDDVTDVSGQLSLDELIDLISFSDGLFSNATGPLHVASAYDIHTLGVYPVHTVPRWKPIGKKAAYLATDPNYQPYETSMQTITVDQVRDHILKWIINEDKSCAH